MARTLAVEQGSCNHQALDLCSAFVDPHGPDLTVESLSEGPRPTPKHHPPGGSRRALPLRSPGRGLRHPAAATQLAARPVTASCRSGDRRSILTELRTTTPDRSEAQ